MPIAGLAGLLAELFQVRELAMSYAWNQWPVVPGMRLTVSAASGRCRRAPPRNDVIIDMTTAMPVPL